MTDLAYFALSFLGSVGGVLFADILIAWSSK